MKINELTKASAVERYTDLAKEHGLDASDNIAVRRLINTADNIRTDCQFYLSQIQAGHEYETAWRGMNTEAHHATQVVLKDVRLDDRNPTDTDVDTHNYINREFTKLYGEPFRNSLFMSGSMRDILRYGRPFQVFPVGQFKFIWSNTVRDLWIESRDLRRALAIPMSRFTDPEEQLKNEQHKSKVFKEFNEKVIGSYKTGDMQGALNSRKEIMVRCKHYYAVSFDNIIKNVLDPHKTQSNLHHDEVRAALETMFYKIVNDK